MIHNDSYRSQVVRTDMFYRTRTKDELAGQDLQANVANASTFCEQIKRVEFAASTQFPTRAYHPLPSF